LKLAALGGPYTFNALAAAAILVRNPEFGTIVYYPTSEDVVDAAMRGDVDAACAPEQTSAGGFHAGMLARMSAPGAALYVVAEISRRYDCSLLGKRGTQLRQIRRIIGHDGSIAHSRAWLEANLPGTEIEVVRTNSESAAQSVLAGDGSIASVGSSNLAAKSGLAELAKAIDDGSEVNYWAISLTPRFSEQPVRLLVTGRFNSDAPALGRMILRLADAGYLLVTACPKASGQKLHEYDYMLRFDGVGRLDDVRAAVAPFANARLAGAWDIRL
jgi:prephenate dehydratase